MLKAGAPLSTTVQVDPTAGQECQLLLLELPTDRLSEVMRRVPHALRSVCRRFCELLDGSCQEACLHDHENKCRQGRLGDVAALLRRLPGLHTLNTNRCEFTTLAFLTACALLTSLKLDASRFPATSLLTLTACARLAALDLWRADRHGHVHALAALTSLRSLRLYYGAATTVAPLARCPLLTSLHLVGCNHLTSLSSLPALSALACLEIRHWAHPPALTPLAACAALVSFTLSSCTTPIDLTPLTACVRLASLHLEHLPGLTDLRPLSACAALACLRLSACSAVIDVAPLASLAGSLTILSLAGCCGVSSVLPLAACERLEGVRIDGCCVPPEQLDFLQTVLSGRLDIQGRGVV